MPKIFNINARILHNVKLGENYFKLIAEVPEEAFKAAEPGQFAHILCSNEILSHDKKIFNDYDDLREYAASNFYKIKESQLLLRRPFCIHNAYKHRSTYVFEFLIRIRGKGTELLAKLKNGDSLEMLAPIGRGFNYKRSVKEERNVILVAGGVGIAPLFFLGHKLYENKNYPSIYFGFEEEFSLNAGSSIENDLRRVSNFYVIASNTIFGEGIHKGFVTDLLDERLKGLTREELDKTDIYACGPMPMLRKVQELAERFDANCEVSLEERMGCGIGACMACVCKVKNADSLEHRRVCVDGPVFNTKLHLNI